MDADDELTVVSDQLHGRRFHVPRTCSDASAASDQSACVVCMDLPKNIILSPCSHNHCCLQCFRRSSLTTCPMCRVPVEYISVLQTGIRLPANGLPEIHRPPVRPISVPTTTIPLRNRGLRTLTHGQSVSYGMSRSSQRISSNTSALAAPPSPIVHHQNNPSSEISTTPSSGSVLRPPIARQAQSSSRVLPLSRSDTIMHDHHHSTNPGHENRPSVPALQPTQRTLGESGHPTQVGSSQSKTIVLVGFGRSFIIPIARKLMTIFPPPRDEPVSSRRRSTIFVDGGPVRLVLIDCPTSSDHTELAARVNRHSPNLILLCADYFDVTSFESVIRLDMEILDYLSIPCHWVLVRSSSAQRSKASNIVEDSDIRIAKHFFSSSRHCFVIPIDGLKNQGNILRLILYIQKHLSQRTSTDSRSTLEDEPQESPSIQQPTSILLRWTNPTRARNRERSYQRFSLGSCLNGNSL